MVTPSQCLASHAVAHVTSQLDLLALLHGLGVGLQLPSTPPHTQVILVRLVPTLAPLC